MEDNLNFQLATRENPPIKTAKPAELLAEAELFNDSATITPISTISCRVRE